MNISILQNKNVKIVHKIVYNVYLIKIALNVILNQYYNKDLVSLYVKMDNIWTLIQILVYNAIKNANHAFKLLIIVLLAVQI